MDIHLYRDCIVTPKYREVFDNIHRYGSMNETAFEQYLRTLQSVVITIDKRYLTGNGKITVPLAEVGSASNYQNGNFEFTAYNYNYMSCDSIFDTIKYTNGQKDNYGYNIHIKQYFFISSVEVKNNVAEIYYEKDVWHTHEYSLGGIHYGSQRFKAGSFSTRFGFLTSSKIVDYGDQFKLQFYKPPMEYTGNNQLRINRLKQSGPYANTTDGYLVVKMSLFDTSTAGTMTQRENKVFVLHYSQGNVLDPTSITPTSSTFSSAPLVDMNYTNILNKLVLLSSTQKTGIPNLTPAIPEKYYQITDAFFIPKSMARYSINNVEYDPLGIPTNPIYYSCIELNNNWDKVLLYDVSRITGQYSMIDPDEANQNVLRFIGSNVVLHKGTIENNFKLIGIGLYTRLFALSPNGNSIDYKITFSASNFDFRVYLNVQNTINDITDDLSITVPISSDTADVASLNMLTRQIKNATLENKKDRVSVNGVSGIVGGVAGIVGGVSSAIMTGGIMGYGQMISGYSGIVSSAYGAELNKKDIENEFKQNNAEVYTTNKGVNVSSIGETNGFYGLVTAEINADNDTEVTNAINAFGYDCSELVDVAQILYLSDTVIQREKFNVLRFSDVTVYGSFPQNIANVFENILKNGVKIWYTHEI